MTSFSPARPWRLLHPPALGLPRQSLCPGTRFPRASFSVARLPPGDRAVLAARGGWVKKEYASVAELPAALLGCHFEHPAGERIADSSEHRGELEPRCGSSGFRGKGEPDTVFPLRKFDNE